MKKYLIFLFVILFSQTSSSQVFRAGDYVYRIVDGGVEVIDRNHDGYLDIPGSVEYEGTAYPVVGIDESFANARVKYPSWVNYNSYVRGINLPASLKYIGDYAFYWCTRLNSLSLPEGLEVIGVNAFLGFEGEIVLPSTIKKVGDVIPPGWEFDNRMNFNAYLPEGLEELGASVYEGSRHPDVKLPSTLKKIGKRCFKDSKIKSIEFGGEITHLPERLLEGCEELRSITIGESVKYIDYFTGYHDNTWDVEYSGDYGDKHHGIKGADFYVYPMVPPAPYGELALGKRGDELQAFGEYYPCSCTLHVPKGTAEAYRNAVGWKAFYHIVDDLPVSKLTVIEDDADEPYFRIEEGRVIADGMIEVYALDGRLIASGTKDELTPLTPGLYVLRIDGRSAKAVVR